MRLDIHYFPHVCEQIVWSASPSSLPALRVVSPLFRKLVDRRLLDHTIYYVTERLIASALLPEVLIPCKVKWSDVRVLDLAMTMAAGGEGNAKAPWVIEDPPGGTLVLLPDALPHMPLLQTIRCLNYQPNVFPHLLRYTAVSLTVYPASRAISWSPRPSAGGRIVGGGVRSPRAVICFNRAPDGDFSFYFRANQHEHLTILLLPDGWGKGFCNLRNYEPPAYSEMPGVAMEWSGGEDMDGWTFWICLTDEIAHHIVESKGRCEVVGLERWGDGAWAERAVRDIGLEEGMERLTFSTLEEWRDENEEVWPLVT